MAVNNINSANGAQIHSLNDPRVQGQANPQQSQPGATAPAGTPGDAVSFTNTAEQLRQAEQALANQPVVDNHKVESVRDQIAAGSFEINAPRIAEKMIQMERLFGG